MFNLVVFNLLFFLVVVSTFIILDFPFIIFFFKDLPPDNINIIYQNSFLIFGTYKSNLQLPIIIFSSLILPFRLNFFFLVLYFYVGIFYGLNIFYNGGGLDYINTDSYSYLLFSVPILLLLSFLSRIKNRAYLFKTKYIAFISLLTLLIIHILGLVSITIKNNNYNIYYSIISYFLIPIFSQSLLVILFSIISVYFNKTKYYLLEKYTRFNKNIIEKFVFGNSGNFR